MNRLAREKSPYLLQHADNPVDWFPWGGEAFEKARREDKPVFLSIGYSTCHWCHVMEHESFSHPGVAALMNEVFVSIKIDREERPDLDEHFMRVCQMLTGAGGWPLTVIVTPDRKPFFAGTYIPRENAYGRMGMVELVPRIRELWKTQRGQVDDSAMSISADLARIDEGDAGRFVPGPSTLKEAAQGLGSRFDSRNGGFGGAPKFPMPTLIGLLLRAWRRTGDPETLGMAERTLAAMRRGGIYDQVGFGFHRYSTDERWDVPHFEKMLYDQALLTMAYTDAWQATGNDLYRRTASEICEYVLRDLRLPEGGFATAEDADSEGVEGKFYTWTDDEILSAVGADGRAVLAERYVLGAPGQMILRRLPADDSPPDALEALLREARARRPRPLRDDKILADMNGLMIAALARAGAAFSEAALVDAAEAAARCVQERMFAPDGGLLHRYREREAAIPGFADDYAFLSLGMFELYQATFDAVWLEKSLQLLDALVSGYWDRASSGFFQTAGADEGIARMKSYTDGVIPSANAVGLMMLERMHRITGRTAYRQMAEQLMRGFPGDAVRESISCSQFLSAADDALGSSAEMVVVGSADAPDTRDMLRKIRQVYAPDTLVLLKEPAGNELLERLAPFTAPLHGVGDKATAFVCRSFTCSLPVTDAASAIRGLGVR
jgi:uncharacterized protein